MQERKYNLTLAELIDRMSICILKSIYISKNQKEYLNEIELIKHDIDLILGPDNKVSANAIEAIQVNAISNRVIWENESKARQGSDEQDKLLKFTHSINGIRNIAKNIISNEMGDRVDLKIDCLAANLPEEFGNWNIFN